MIITGNEMEDREDSHEENGPKQCVGKFFFGYFRVFLILTNVLLCIGPVNYEIDNRGSSYEENRPNNVRRVVGP